MHLRRPSSTHACDKFVFHDLGASPRAQRKHDHDPYAFPFCFTLAILSAADSDGSTRPRKGRSRGGGGCRGRRHREERDRAPSRRGKDALGIKQGLALMLSGSEMSRFETLAPDNVLDDLNGCAGF